MEHEPFESTDSKGGTHRFVLSSARCTSLTPGAIGRLEIEVALTPDELGDGYNAAFEQVQPGVWRPFFVNNRAIPHYAGKGLTAAVYRPMARTTGGVVQSSTRGGAGGWDDRNELADKVWRTLEAQGAAIYDAVEDRFYLPKKPE